MPKKNSFYSHSGRPTTRVAYWIRLHGKEHRIGGSVFAELAEAGLLRIKKEREQLKVGELISHRGDFKDPNIKGSVFDFGNEAYVRLWAIINEPLVPDAVARALRSLLGLMIARYGV